MTCPSDRQWLGSEICHLKTEPVRNSPYVNRTRIINHVMVKVGDRVILKGDTQDYILVDPTRTYSGEVIGKDDGQVFVRLDKPVRRGVNKFEEVAVPEHRARPE